MRFCTICGTERKDNQSFCNSCGNKYEEDIPQETVRIRQDERHNSTQITGIDGQLNEGQRQQATRKKMPLFMKFLIGALVVLVAIGFGGHKYLESTYSPKKTVAAFEEAINKQDIDKVKEVLDTSNFKAEVNDRDLKKYLAFLKENKSDLIKGLNVTASKYEKGKTSNESVYDNNNNELVKLVETEKKFGIYQQYEIEAVPFKLIVEANLEEVEVELDGKKGKIKNNFTFKSIVPGSTELIGVYKGEYANFTENVKLDFNNAEENTLNVFLDFDVNYVNIYSNAEDSILFVNGKSTETIVEDFYEPLPTDGSITLHAVYQTENGAIKSNEIKIKNTDEVYLEFNEDELYPPEPTSYDVIYSLEDFMQQYIYTSVEAMNNGDFSIVEEFHHPDGKSYQESKDYIDYIVSKGIKEDVLSVEVVSHEELENYEYLVHTIEEYNIHYSDGTTKRKKFISSYRVNVSELYGYRLWALESTNEI